MSEGTNGWTRRTPCQRFGHSRALVRSCVRASDVFDHAKHSPREVRSCPEKSDPEIGIDELPPRPPDTASAPSPEAAPRITDAAAAAATIERPSDSPTALAKDGRTAAGSDVAPSPFASAPPRQACRGQHRLPARHCRARTSFDPTATRLIFIDRCDIAAAT